MMERATSHAEGTTLKVSSIARMPAFSRNVHSGSLQQGVYEFLRDAIVSGVVEAGANLPSTRSLATEWGVSRNTILAAYEQLAIEGLVISRRGSGTRVRGRRLRLRQILRESQFPVTPLPLRDPDGNAIYIH